MKVRFSDAFLVSQNKSKTKNAKMYMLLLLTYVMLAFKFCVSRVQLLALRALVLSYAIPFLGLSEST